MLAIDKINRKLRENGMSGQDIARALGLSNSAYSNWNRGKTKISGKNLKRIAEEVFHCPVEEIMDDPAPEENKKAAVQTDDGIDEQGVRLLRWFLSKTPTERVLVLEAIEASPETRKVLDVLLKL